MVDDLTVDYVISRLLNEEARQNVIGSLDANSALVAAGPCRDFRNITCYLCQEKGHYQSHCPRRNTLASPAPTIITHSENSTNVALTANDTFSF